jgi:hypothetical protein
MRVQAAPGPGPSKDGALAAFVPYVYRGTGRDTLTPNMPGRGRRPRRRRAAVKRVAGADGRCEVCEYMANSRNCKTVH